MSSISNNGWYVNNKTFSPNSDDYIFKIQLKPCMKITGGNGDSVNPYILIDQC